MTGLTGPPARPRRSLQARLTLFYATGIFAAGVVVLAVVAVPLAGIQSAAPKGSPASGAITGAGNGIGPHQLLAGSAVALALLIPIALAAGWLVAGRFLRPLRAITATARAISAGNLHQRLDLGEPGDELTELGCILDDLFARLEASFDAQRHFVANASHELRTPLAGLRTLLEVTLADPDADAGALRSACQEALVLGGHQERLVQALLTLATSERGVTRRDTLDLAQAVTGVLASRRDQAAVTGVDLAGHLMRAVTAGDPGLIESLIANLIDNAIRHNHPGGHVDITTQTAGGQATLTVTNSGPAVPGDQIQRLFQPFQRLAPDRNGRRDGYGIGLAIVNAVTEAHHATLTTSARPEGGLSITVRFGQVPASRGGSTGRACTDAAVTTAATSSPPRR
jgi:signal transduction histidine kinase